VLGPVFIYLAASVAIHPVLAEPPREVYITLCIAFNMVVDLSGIEAAACPNGILLCAQLPILALFLILAGGTLVRDVTGSHLSAAPPCGAIMRRAFKELSY